MPFFDVLCLTNVAFVFGLLWIILAIWKINESIQREKAGYNTTGKIVDVYGEWTRAQRGWAYSYYAIIQIIDQEGKLIERKSSKSIFPNLWSKGKTIPVVYVDNDIYPTGLKWMLIYIFFILAGVALISYCLISRYF